MNQKTVNKFRNGHNAAFEDIFTSLYTPLCSFADTYLKDRNLAEDIVQEIFITLWHKRKDFINLLSLKTFLYRSVSNKCLNHIKHEKVINKYQEVQLEKTQSETFYNDHIIEEETHRLIYRAIDELPPSCKEIVYLSLQGLKNPEIAEELSISVNTIKTQKALAYKKLRIKLKDIILFLTILPGYFFL